MSGSDRRRATTLPDRKSTIFRTGLPIRNARPATPVCDWITCFSVPRSRLAWSMPGSTVKCGGARARAITRRPGLSFKSRRKRAQENPRAALALIRFLECQNRPEIALSFKIGPPQNGPQIYGGRPLSSEFLISKVAP